MASIYLCVLLIELFVKFFVLCVMINCVFAGAETAIIERRVFQNFPY